MQRNLHGPQNHFHRILEKKYSTTKMTVINWCWVMCDESISLHSYCLCSPVICIKKTFGCLRKLFFLFFSTSQNWDRRLFFFFWCDDTVTPPTGKDEQHPPSCHGDLLMVDPPTSPRCLLGGGASHCVWLHHGSIPWLLWSYEVTNQYCWSLLGMYPGPDTELLTWPWTLSLREGIRIKLL